MAHHHDVLLWARSGALTAELAARRENTRYLPGCPLPAQLRYSDDLEAAWTHAAAHDGLYVAAVPVAGLRPLCEAFGARLAGHRLVWLCKGFEADTGLLPHQVVADVLGERVPDAGVLSGPSFALEVAQGRPAALTVASTSAALCDAAVRACHHGALRIYSTDDLIGVEVGGAVKNVLAIATGIGDGLGLGLNARAALVTRGLAEMTRLGIALGGRVETFMGLAGMGDLILTATGNLSRNRTVGLQLADGRTLDEVLAALGHVAEGVRCAATVRELAHRHGVPMPITEAVCEVLFEGLAPRDAVEALLRRDARAEAEPSTSPRKV